MRLSTTKSFLILAVVATGTLVAQRPMRHQGHFRAMSTELGLSDAQKAQAKGIFQSAHQTARPLADQVRQDRQALKAAIQAGKSDQELQQLAAAEGADVGRLAGVRAAAMAKFRAMLTPDQQQKLDAMRTSRGKGRRSAA